jgi:arsenite methyltransferase
MVEQVADPCPERLAGVSLGIDSPQTEVGSGSWRPGSRRISGWGPGECPGGGQPLARVPKRAPGDATDQAPDYDRAMAAVRPLHRRVARQLSALVPRGGTVLDLGCGGGHLLEELLALRPDCLAIAVDQSSAMLARAHARLTAAGLCERCLFLREDMTTPLPLRCEAVVSVFAAHQLADAAQLRRFLVALAGYAQDGAAVVLWDLARPRQPESIPAFRAAFHPGCIPCTDCDLEASLRAAWSRAEVQAACRSAGLAARVACPPVVPLVPLWLHVVVPATQAASGCLSADGEQGTWRGPASDGRGIRAPASIHPAPRPSPAEPAWSQPL